MDFLFEIIMVPNNEGKRYEEIWLVENWDKDQKTGKWLHSSKYASFGESYKIENMFAAQTVKELLDKFYQTGEYGNIMENKTVFTFTPDWLFRKVDKINFDACSRAGSIIAFEKLVALCVGKIIPSLNNTIGWSNYMGVPTHSDHCKMLCTRDHTEEEIDIVGTIFDKLQAHPDVWLWYEIKKPIDENVIVHLDEQVEKLLADLKMIEEVPDAIDDEDDVEILQAVPDMPSHLIEEDVEEKFPELVI